MEKAYFCDGAASFAMAYLISVFPTGLFDGLYTSDICLKNDFLLLMPVMAELLLVNVCYFSDMCYVPGGAVFLSRPLTTFLRRERLWLTQYAAVLSHSLADFINLYSAETVHSYYMPSLQ